MSSDSQTKVSGRFMIDGIKGMGREVRPILARYQADMLDPDEWYPQQTWLDILKAVSQEARVDLMSVGGKASEFFHLPSGIQSIQRLLDIIHESYNYTHNNAGSMYFCVEVLDERMVKIVDHSPYPDDLQFGMIFGLFDRLMPFGANLRVRYAANTPRRSDGADTTTYIVTW